MPPTENTGSFGAFKSILFAVGVMLAMLSGGFNGLYVADGLAGDGMSPGDVFLSIAAGMACFTILTLFSWIGTHVIPNLERGARAVPLAIYTLCAALILVLSSTPNFLVQTKSAVAVAEQTQLLKEVRNDYSESVKAARSLENTIPIVRANHKITKGLLSDEMTKGAVCGRGAGLGECSSQIEALAGTLVTAETALLDVSAQTKRLERRGNELMAEINRASGHKDLSWSEKNKVILDRVRQVADVTDKINQKLPFDVLVSVSDATSKNWRHAGFSPEGAAIMTSSFASVSGRIDEATAIIKSVKYRNLTNTEPQTGVKAALKHLPDIAAQAALALLIDFIPMLGIATLIAVAWNEQRRKKRPERENVFQPSKFRN